MENNQTTKQPVRVVRDAVAYARANDDGSITLHPYSALAEFDDGFYKMLTRGDFAAAHLVDAAEPESLFFYTATQFKVDSKEFHNRKIAVEKGVGKLFKWDNHDGKGPQTLFNRVIVHSVHEATSHGPLTQTRTLGSPPFPFSNDDYITVYAHAPEHYQDTLLLEHSVVCTIEPYTPSPVHLENNTVLGRMGGRIQSLDKDELKTLMEVGGPSPTLVLVPTDDAPKPRGTLYFSLQGNALKFFDGVTTRTVKFEEDAV